MMSTADLIIVTDLDGSLLDHHNYSYQEALPMLNRLREENIPLVFNTSKTKAELEILRQELNHQDPFVVENGSGLYLPSWHKKSHYDCHLLGARYQRILDQLAPLWGNFKFEGFSQWSDEQLAEKTGLSLKEAGLAKQREFSEPILWQDSEAAFKEFRTLLKNEGLTLLKGGRFHHVLGMVNKGDCFSTLRDWYFRNRNRQARFIALGDGENDVAMFEAADIAIVIRSAVNPLPKMPIHLNPLISENPGPLGWAECLEQVLKTEFNI